MLQVLTKEELKELIKARKLIVAGIERCPKNGKYIVIQNTLGAPLINLPLDLLSAILEAPQDQHPSQQDINETLQSVSCAHVHVTVSLTETLLLLAQSKEGRDTHYSKDLKVSVGSYWPGPRSSAASSSINYT
jgi:hypothetical protein